MKKQLFFIVILFITLGLFVALGLFAQERRPENGDIGPGGGMVFFYTQSENTYTFWECSKDLGKATWGQAKINARNYQGGNLNDWTLVSPLGLKAMYYDLKLSGIEDFAENTVYWSDQEASDIYAEGFDFKKGYEDSYVKTTQLQVRAVRSFEWVSPAPPQQENSPSRQESRRNR